MIKVAVALALSLAILAGCAEKGKESPIEEVRAAAFSSGGQPKLTLITVINNRSGAGAHTALLIEGSQSVIFDPAGSFEHERIPERGDVLYGITPAWVQSYRAAHARETFHVVSQEINVTPAQAERALQLVEARGAVPSALCTNSTSGILQQIQGFQSIRQVFFPVKLMEQFAELPGVTTSKYFEDDKGNVTDGIVALAN